MAPRLDNLGLTAAQQADLVARWQITGLEASQARAVREFILGDPSAKGRLQAIDNQIVALRAQLT